MNLGPLEPYVFYVKVAALAAVAALLVAGGWTMKAWKDSGVISHLEGTIETQKQSIATLVGANERCAASVQDVKGAVQAYVAAGVRRSEEAAAAMELAAAAAKGHQAAATAALGRVQAPKGKECETAAGEASAYVKKRRASP